MGEDRFAKLIFLALTSRFLDRPVSVAVKGPSPFGEGVPFLARFRRPRQKLGVSPISCQTALVHVCNFASYGRAAQKSYVPPPCPHNSLPVAKSHTRRTGHAIVLKISRLNFPPF